MNHDDDLVFALHAATVSQPGIAFALRDIDWTIRQGETWAITGPMGSGKTMLAETILGRRRLNAGTIRWPILDHMRDGGKFAFPSDAFRLVTFRDESRLFSPAKHYYQQRFNFVDPVDDLTLGDFLQSSSTDEATVRSMAARFGLNDKLALSFLKLSHGQSRRARLAKALASQPEMLILDDPFVGLDAATRIDFSGLLGELAAGGLPLILVMGRSDIPYWVTHVLELSAGRVALQGPRRDYKTRRISNQSSTAIPVEDRDSLLGEPIVELTNVNVSYCEKVILANINWTVRAGEKWAVLGPNGAGKSTLLSLLCGDHPQAYSSDVRLFGRKRGTGESIWDIKRHIGLVSPEMHVYFTEPLTAEHAAATGYFDSLTPKPTTAEQDAGIRSLFQAFGIESLADRPFARLSVGEQRLVLLVRALVKRPPLLILDEPFQGLDQVTMNRVRDWLDANIRPDQTLLFVTHHSEEIPRCVTKTLRLREGRVE